MRGDTNHIIGELRRLCQTIKTAPHKEAKEAKKAIQKLIDRDLRTHRARFVDIFISELDTFDSIANPINQSFLVSALDTFFLSGTDTHFEYLSRFVLKAIQHPDGRVREAVRHAASWLRFKHTEAGRGRG